MMAPLRAVGAGAADEQQETEATMPGLMDIITRAVGGDTMQQLSRQLGASEQSTGTAVSAALPLLLSALARNASSPQGANALLRALDNDHDGSVLDNLSGLISNAEAGPGAGILGHVLGDRQDAAKTALAQVSGMNAGSAGQLLTLLAPVVMGALGRAQRQQGLDAGALGSLLQNEHQDLHRNAPDAMGLVTQLLGQEGGGLSEIGGRVGKLLGGR
jgi:hypothetical protein